MTVPVSPQPEPRGILGEAHVQAIVREVALDEAMVYSAEAAASAQIIPPPTFKLLDYPGLLLCYVIRHPGAHDTLVTFWRSRDHYECGSAKCFQDLAVTAMNHGWLAAIIERRETLSRRIKAALLRPTMIVTLLATGTAIYTNLASLRNAATNVFVAPNSQLADEPRRLLRGDQTVALQGRITNFGEVNSNITLTRFELTPESGGLGLPVSPPRLPKIEPGKDGTIAFQLIPRHKGEFTVTLRGVARNDWFAKREIVWPIPVSVWEPIDRGSSELSRVMDGGTRCLVRCRLRIGKANDAGFFCGVKLEGEPDVNFETSIQCPSRPNPTVTSLPAAGENKTRIVQIEWDSPGKTEAFTICEFYIRLKSETAKTPDEWSRIALKVTPDAALKQP